MFREMLYTHWKWSRLELAVFCVAGFVIPVLTMKTLTAGVTSGADVIPISSLLSASIATGGVLLVLAALCAVTLAVRPWTVDESRAHVFAQSLPLSWAAFARLRFLAGAALLVVPAAAVWLGGILGAVAMPIPASLHAYPTSVAARFLGGALVLYAAVFAFQYLAGRRAARVGAWILIGLVVLELVTQSLGFRSVSYELWRAFTSWPGPFRLMTARWMLIDV